MTTTPTSSNPTPETRYAVIRRLEPFDMGHRVPEHNGKCKNYHGHTWTLEVCVSAPVLDTVGVVIDFGELKARIGGWINAHLDHGMCLHHADPMAEWLTLQALLTTSREHGPAMGSNVLAKVKRDRCLDSPHKLYLMDEAPTSENLARLLFEKAKVLLADIPGLRVEWVRLYETASCSAVYPFGSPPPSTPAPVAVMPAPEPREESIPTPPLPEDPERALQHTDWRSYAFVDDAEARVCLRWLSDRKLYASAKVRNPNEAEAEFQRHPSYVSWSFARARLQPHALVIPTHTDAAA